MHALSLSFRLFFLRLFFFGPGAIAGLLAARYLAPALVWGGVAGESEGIRPDSGAKTWAIRREKLTDQYVSRLAAQATGRSAMGGSTGEESKFSTNQSDAANGNAGMTKNLSQLSAGAIQVRPRYVYSDI